jgi:hypothetical protein
MSEKNHTKKINNLAKSNTFEWKAPEFVYHKKTNKWYLYLALATIALIVGYLLIFKDIVTPILILLMAFIFGYYGSKKPKMIKYSAGPDGVSVDKKTFPLEALKSYSVQDYKDLSVVIIVPVKRFATLITMYYHPEDEDKVLGFIETVVPFDNRQEDLIDRFSRHIGF